MIDNRKRCGVCEALHPPTREYWQAEKRNRDGFSGTCRMCMNAQGVARYDARLAAQGKVKRPRRKQPLERVLYMRAYRQRNAAALRAYRQRWERERKRARFASVLKGVRP